MTMEHRNEWPIWVATAVGLLGLVGLASAQPTPHDALGALPNERMVHHDGSLITAHRKATERVLGTKPITDDGRSADVPLTRQLIVVRNDASEGSLLVELFNEHGDVLQSVPWNATRATRKTIDLNGLFTGRYAVRISGGGRSDVVRFRQD